MAISIASSLIRPAGAAWTGTTECGAGLGTADVGGEIGPSRSGSGALSVTCFASVAATMGFRSLAGSAAGAGLGGADGNATPGCTFGLASAMLPSCVVRAGGAITTGLFGGAWTEGAGAGAVCKMWAASGAFTGTRGSCTRRVRWTTSRCAAGWPAIRLNQVFHASGSTTR